MSDFKFEIVKELGVLSESKSGWTRELTPVSWTGAATKYDIRDLSPGHEKMGKGVSLSAEEVTELKRLLEKIED